ncbi:MAG TPA: phasin family protein [Hyphomicrobium sp.]|jgi:phasin
MYDKPQFEIPEAVRELAERNVEQARTAYNQFVEMARKVQETVAKSQGAMASGAVELQMRIAKFAEENIQASFAFASDLSRARDLKEYIEIQQRYAQKQMRIYAEQAQELGRLMSEAAQKAQPRG